jgi:hypothetical protein
MLDPNLIPEPLHKPATAPQLQSGSRFLAVGQPGLEPGANGLREGTSEVA